MKQVDYYHAPANESNYPTTIEIVIIILIILEFVSFENLAYFTCQFILFIVFYISWSFRYSFNCFINSINIKMPRLQVKL